MRWYFWYIRHSGRWVPHGPERLTNRAAVRLEHETQRRYLGARMYRWIYDAGRWRYDTRTGPQLLAGAPLGTRRA